MRILTLADIHIGAIKDVNYVYSVMTSIIDKEIMSVHADAVVILGDYFDRLFKANENYVSLAINVMSYLVRACSKNKVKIRIVYGTESHEMDQYKLFNYHFTSHKVDMKLITTATEEELFPGCNVLYLPEEYIMDKHEFYKDNLYSGKHYKYIFGHGVIEDGMPQVVSYIRPNPNEKHVAHFRSGELGASCDLCVFGHYHKHTIIDGNVHYLGSLFRWQFGEEEPKGYGIINDDELDFIPNEKAYLYKTYEFDNSSKIYESMDELVKQINLIKDENKELFDGSKPGKIRIIFHPSESNDPSFKENLRTLLYNDKIISSLIKEENSTIISEAKSEVDDEYAFILDNNMAVDDKIYQYITKLWPDDLFSMEELIHYIHDPLKV